MARAVESERDADAPIRLADVLPIAFPFGGVTLAGLRRERDAGRLDVFRLGGREFTTLGAVERMIELCRDLEKERASGCARREQKVAAPDRRHGSSSIGESNTPRDSALMKLKRLRELSQSTSPQNTSPRDGKNVIPLKSTSRT